MFCNRFGDNRFWVVSSDGADGEFKRILTAHCHHTPFAEGTSLKSPLRKDEPTVEYQ
ncbi:MAG: hypothetical protein SFZ03_06530 [Candidatus Melainabacteria bacterium]|nr:hypothetical protein [Candidatus Melainabacteria bacterium]